nr:hypothetical protein [Halomonas populi]
MAWLAYRLQVVVAVSAARGNIDDVINLNSRRKKTLFQTGLAQAFVTSQDLLALTAPRPAAAIPLCAW